MKKKDYFVFNISPLGKDEISYSQNGERYSQSEKEDKLIIKIKSHFFVKKASKLKILKYTNYQRFAAKNKNMLALMMKIL